jgi:hypothetical protein
MLIPTPILGNGSREKEKVEEIKDEIVKPKISNGENSFRKYNQRKYNNGEVIKQYFIKKKKRLHKRNNLFDYRCTYFSKEDCFSVCSTGHYRTGIIEIE